MSNRLKELILERGYSIQELAREMSVSRQALYFILAGQRMPSLRTAIKLSKSLAITIDELARLVEKDAKKKF